MSKMAETVKPLIIRPYVLFIFGLLTLIYCFIEYTFVFPVILGISYLKSGNILENGMHIIQFVLSFIFQTQYLIYAVGALVILALLGGIVLSGCLYPLNKALERKGKVKGEFLTGIKKYFLRMMLILMRTMLYSIIFVLFMMIVTVPSMVITNSFAAGKNELMTAAIAFDIVTVIVLFFGFLFFRIYMMFWYPAAINTTRKFFAIGKLAADTYFWEVASKLILFDIVFAAFQFLLIYLNSVMPVQSNVGFIRVLILLFVNWIFKTLFLIGLIIFVFSKFILFKKTVKVSS